MRVAFRFTLLAVTAALAGCGDDKHPTEPPVDKPPEASAAVFCPTEHIYPLKENTWDLAFISINGHSLAGAASDGGIFDYSLDITPEIAGDLQRGAAAGCLSQVRFVTAGDVGTVGAGQASFSASTQVKIRVSNGGTNLTKTFRDGFKAPPLPAGCTTIVCMVPRQRIVIIPATLQAGFQPNGKITVHSDATAHVTAGGTSVWDQALSDFAIPHGDGRNPDGPVLVVTSP